MITVEQCCECNSSNGHLMRCQDSLSTIGNCKHVVCESCFRNENKTITESYKPRCPQCKSQYYDHIQTLSEAVLIGQAAHINSIGRFSLQRGVDEAPLHSILKNAIVMYEEALLLGPTNIITKQCLIYSYNSRCDYLQSKRIPTEEEYAEATIKALELKDFSQRLYNYFCDILMLGTDADIVRLVKQPGRFWWLLTNIYFQHDNYAPAVKYAKLAYSYHLRSSDHTHIEEYKRLYLKICTAFAALPPLRFAVGDVVEFLHESEIGSEWKLGKVVELYYRERDFDITFSSSYRLQLPDASASIA